MFRVSRVSQGSSQESSLSDHVSQEVNVLNELPHSSSSPPQAAQRRPGLGGARGPLHRGVRRYVSVPLAQVRLMKSIADVADVRPVLSKLLLIKDYMLDRENMR